MRITKIPNPYCTKDIIPNIEVWAVKNDLVSQMENICKRFISSHPNEPLTIVAPNSRAGKDFADKMRAFAPDTLFANDVYGIFSEKVRVCIWDDKSAFRKTFNTHEAYLAAVEELWSYFRGMEYHEPEEDYILQLHLIANQQLKETVAESIIQLGAGDESNSVKATHHRHMVFIDEHLRTDKDILEAAHSIASYYEPCSITVFPIL